MIKFIECILLFILSALFAESPAVGVRRLGFQAQNEVSICAPQGGERRSVTATELWTL